MRSRAAASIRNATLAALLGALSPHAAGATGADTPTVPQVDPAPCVAAVNANDDDTIIAACGPLIDNEKTARADRIKALIARAGVFIRRDLIDRAIDDDSTVLRLDPALADIYNARGELWRRKGDRPRALADFGAALKLNPDQPAAKSNYKSLAQELERLGALLAVNDKPSFNCATAKRPVEKAICGNPELATLDWQINAVNTRVVRDAGRANPGGGRTLQREQDDFLRQRDTAFGRPDYDLLKVMRARLDHLLAVGRN